MNIRELREKYNLGLDNDPKATSIVKVRELLSAEVQSVLKEVVSEYEASPIKSGDAVRLKKTGKLYLVTSIFRDHFSTENILHPYNKAFLMGLNNEKLEVSFNELEKVA